MGRAVPTCVVMINKQSLKVFKRPSWVGLLRFLSSAQRSPAVGSHSPTIPVRWNSSNTRAGLGPLGVTGAEPCECFRAQSLFLQVSGCSAHTPGLPGEAAPSWATLHPASPLPSEGQRTHFLGGWREMFQQGGHVKRDIHGALTSADLFWGQENVVMSGERKSKSWKS